MRDLQKDLAYLNEDGIRVGIPCMKEWIERAIKAEEENQKHHKVTLDQCRVINDFRHEEILWKEKLAALTEENDIQRASIQTLSGQVAALRELIRTIKSCLECDECLHPHENGVCLHKTCAYRNIHNALGISLQGGDTP